MPLEVHKQAGRQAAAKGGINTPRHTPVITHPPTCVIITVKDVKFKLNRQGFEEAGEKWQRRHNIKRHNLPLSSVLPNDLENLCSKINSQTDFAHTRRLSAIPVYFTGDLIDLLNIKQEIKGKRKRFLFGHLNRKN